METAALGFFVFLSGLTVAGLSGTLIELSTGRPVSFDTLARLRGRLWACLALAAAAGPFMLANEALQARRRGSLSAASLAAAFAASALWALALGIVAIEVAFLALAVLAMPLP